MPNIQGIILDVDGTLVDSNDAHAHAWVEALSEHGYHHSFEEVRRLIGMGGDNLLPTLTGLQSDSPEGKLINDRWREIFETNYMQDLQPFPEVRPLLERMRADGLQLVVASSAEQGELKKLLDIAHVRDLIEQETSSDDAEKSKPAPDIVQAALKRLGDTPKQTIMLGDTPYDIESAGKAGVAVIALRCGGWDDADLGGALAIYDDPADLLAHYNDSPLAHSAPKAAH